MPDSSSGVPREAERPEAGGAGPQKSGTGRQEEDPRVRLAAERTLLAWIRTSLAMMGFGFVVARFGLFLREIAEARHGPAPHSTAVSLGIGMALVTLGVVINVAAAVQHVGFLARLDRGEAYQAPRWSLAVITAVLLALLGAGIGGYLLLHR